MVSLQLMPAVRPVAAPPLPGLCASLLEGTLPETLMSWLWPAEQEAGRLLGESAGSLLGERLLGKSVGRLLGKSAGRLLAGSAGCLQGKSVDCLLGERLLGKSSGLLLGESAGCLLGRVRWLRAGRLQAMAAAGKVPVA